MRRYYMSTWILLLYFTYTSGAYFNISDSWEAALHKDVFLNRPLVCPKAAYADTLQIDVSLDPLFLQELNAANQIFSLIATLIFKWKDESLMWDPASYGNATTIFVPSSWVWKPKFGVLNSAVQNVFDEDTKNKYEVVVTHNGTVIWYMSETFTTSCAIDALKFPFDTQTCVVSITGWAGGAVWENYTGVPVKHPVNFIIGNEWDYVSRNGTNRYDTRFGYDASTVDYAFTFKRKPDFYVLSMIVPLMVLSVLGILVFPLPADSGDKIALGITVVLSFTVMESSVRDNLPPSFPSTPYIVKLIFSMLLFNALSLTTTVSVIVICLKKPYHKVPKWLEKCITPKGNKTEKVAVIPIGNISTTDVDSNMPHDHKSREPLDNIQEGVRCADTNTDEELREKWEKVANLVNRVCFVVFFVLQSIIFVFIFLGWFFL